MKKVMLTCLLFMTLFLFTGCGASVTSKTEFEQDGSGTRTISAVISASDAKNIEGGFYELDLLLEQAAPEGLNIARTTLENGDALYQFSFHFNNIDEYNQKIETITGKEHNATWYSDASVFLSNISFSEQECTYDLISWALDAFKSSKYSRFSSYFTLYQVDKNEVYYKNELVFSGKENPAFTVDISPSLENVSMYSDYSYEGEVQKKLVLAFHEGALEVLNIEDVKRILNAYSTEYKIDMANNTITFTLKGQQVKEFIQKIDPDCQDADLVYNSTYNPFQKKYEIVERYNLKNFFALFQMEHPYIYNYIKVPEVVGDSRVSYLSQLAGIEVPDGYDYAGAYRYDNTYTADFASNQMVDMKGIALTYRINKELEAERVVELSITKNGCLMTEQELMKYYPNIHENISVTDDTDVIKIAFTSKVKKDQEGQETGSSLKMNRLRRENLKYIHYGIQDELALSNYLPVLEGYTWNLDKITCTYQVLAEEKAGVDSFSVNEFAYENKTSLESIHQPGIGYVVEGEWRGIDSIFTIDITCTTVYDLYYFWIIGLLFIIIVAILITAVVYIRKQSQIPQEKDLV